jgi:Bacterial aa3 type cytochrome c oxidase subunit IV
VRGLAHLALRDAVAVRVAPRQQEDGDMAADGDAGKDLRAHESSYARFTFMMKWGTILAAITGMIVIWVIHA